MLGSVDLSTLTAKLGFKILVLSYKKILKYD